MTKEPESSESRRSQALGVFYAVAAFLLWGILPLYWKVLHSVPAVEILMHRIAWSFVFAAFILFYRGEWRQIKAVLAQRRKLAAIAFGAVLISLNWGIYIWAVNANHVVDTSLGYYINPLISVFLGMLVLKERLNFWQLASLALAFAGVLIMTFQYGKVPWVSLSLAFSFALYGLIKKTAKIESATALTLETATLLPLALGYLGYLQLQGSGALGHSSIVVTLFLVLSGVVTAAPLLWFAQATQRIPLSAVGFIQYLTPTMMLIIGVILYHEPFTKTHLIGFACIWIALALFSLSRFEWMKRRQPRLFRCGSHSVLPSERK